MNEPRLCQGPGCSHQLWGKRKLFCCWECRKAATHRQVFICAADGCENPVVVYASQVDFKDIRGDKRIFCGRACYHKQRRLDAATRPPVELPPDTSYGSVAP